MQVDSEKDLAEQVKNPMAFHLRSFDEEAMVESGLLRTDRNIQIRISGPAFHPCEHVNTTVDDLLRNPAQILMLPREDGDQMVSLTFHDSSGHKCGAFVLPIAVREREPLISQRALRIVQIAATILGMAAGIKLILEALLDAGHR